MKRIIQEFTDYLSQLGYAQVSVYKKHNYHAEEFISYLQRQGVTVMDEVSIYHIIDYREYLHNRDNKVRGGKLSATSIYNKMRTLQLLFEMLQVSRKITYNPMSEIEVLIPRSGQRKVILTEEEIHQLYEVCSDYKERSILSLGYGCGLRVGEMERMNIGDIHFDDEYLIIPQGKGNKRRAVPMSKGVIKDLKGYYYEERTGLTTGRDYNPKDKAFMLHKRGGRMRVWTYNITLKDLIDRTRSKDIQSKQIGMHHLRHSIASHLTERGLDVNQVRQFLGHKLLTTTQIYTHVNNKQVMKI